MPEKAIKYGKSAVCKQLVHLEVVFRFATRAEKVDHLFGKQSSSSRTRTYEHTLRKTARF